MASQTLLQPSTNSYLSIVPAQIYFPTNGRRGKSIQRVKYHCVCGNKYSKPLVSLYDLCMNTERGGYSHPLAELDNPVSPLHTTTHLPCGTGTGSLSMNIPVEVIITSAWFCDFRQNYQEVPL